MKPYNMPEILKDLETLQHLHNIDLMGFAEMNDSLYLRKDASDFLLSQGFTRSISLALHLSSSVCDLLFKQHDRGMLFYFTKHVRARAALLDMAADQIAVYLNDKGFRACAIPGQGSAYPDENPRTILSHITQARLAGLGTMGDSGMLLSERFGPRIRLTTIITDCPLPVSAPLAKDICTHCGLCTKLCPAKAITGKHFDPSKPDILYTDKSACAVQRDKNQELYGSRFCNLCMAVCPIGKN